MPPVTRKYEVIEQYAIVADEDEVQRKMKVSLPEDHNEKLSAQKNGTEESDMEIPEVKDNKPRKQPGEVERKIDRECCPEVRSWIRMHESLGSSKGFSIWMMAANFRKL